MKGEANCTRPIVHVMRGGCSRGNTFESDARVMREYSTHPFALAMFSAAGVARLGIGRLPFDILA